jgi:hypothetical protein
MPLKDVFLKTLYQRQKNVFKRGAALERIHAHYRRMNLEKRGAEIAEVT